MAYDTASNLRKSTKFSTKANDDIPSFALYPWQKFGLSISNPWDPTDPTGPNKC